MFYFYIFLSLFVKLCDSEYEYQNILLQQHMKCTITGRDRRADRRDTV